MTLALDALGLAWQEVEAALPVLADGSRGGVAMMLMRKPGGGYDARVWVSSALSAHRYHTLKRYAHAVQADTPAEALRNLAAKLRGVAP